MRNFYKNLKTLTLLALLTLGSVNVLALDEFVWVTDHNGSSTFNSFSNSDISNSVYSKTANHVTFKINDVSLLTGMLSYGIQNANKTVNSQFSWAPENSNYTVSVTGVSIQLKGYQAKFSWHLKAAYARFLDGTTTGTRVDCQTNEVSGGTSAVSISASPVKTPLTLKKETGGNDVIYSMTSITYTYKVTHKEYLFGFAASASPNNSSYGSTSASVASSTVQAGVGIMSASTTATFTATPKDGYAFAGWYTSSACTGTAESTNNPYNPTINNTKAGSTQTKTLYAKFVPVEVSPAESTSAISFNHPETKTVTVYFPVSAFADAKADFNAPTITANKTWTIKSWNLNTSTHKVEVVCEFVANSDVAKGSYVATVTLQAKSNQSNTGTVTANVDLTPTLTYKNNSVLVSVNDEDKYLINVDTLRTAYKGADNVAGDGTITYALKTANSNVSLTSAGIFYAKEAGTFTIVASATKGRYYAKTAEFNVAVGKRTPVVTWNVPEHIYASDVLNDPASTSYAGHNVALTRTYESLNPGVMTVSGLNITANPQLTQQSNCSIKVITTETAYYESVTAYHEYTVEPKATPEFYLNDALLEADSTAIELYIGETANMRFVNTEESQFSVTSTFNNTTYTHNTTNHTGVITATKFGNEGILFSQGGTTTIFQHDRKVQVFVKKHPVALTTTLNGGTWKVDSVYTSSVYGIETTTGDANQPMNAVTITSSDESVLKPVDGGWKAVGAGTATLTIAQKNNDYWTGDTITATITVEQYTPVFTWHVPATVNWNRAFPNPVSSTNEDEECTFSYSSNNISAINYVNGALRTFEKNANNVTITVTQAGNYKWAEKSQTFYVNVEKMANHVEFTVNSEALYNAVNGGTQGSVVWDGNNGIRLGGSATGAFDSPAWDWGDKFIDIAFEGVPKKISFTTGLTSGAATAMVVNAFGIGGKGNTNGFWYVIEYSKTGAAHTIWTEEDNNNPGKKEFDLLPSTNKVRICYTGNFAGYVKNLKITERTEINGVNSVDFGTTDAGSNATNKNITIDWYNVNPLTLSITGTNASQFSVSPTSIASAKDSYAEKVPVTLSYKHDRGGNDAANLVISDGVTTKTISLSGVTEKMTPAITWKENLSPLSRGENVTDPATAPVSLTYSSSATTIVDIDGNILKPLKKGNATITASFDGTNDPVWNSNSSTIDVEVTDMHAQHIIWNQTFTRLKWTDKPELSDKNTADFDLVATVNYYDVDLEQEVLLDHTITFTSDDPSVVQVLPGNILHVVGIGTTTLRAHVDGITNEFVEANVSRPVVVREPSLDCDTWVLENKSGSIAVINEVFFDLDGEADSLYFDAWREIIHIVFDFSDGDLYVAEVYEDGSEKVLWNNETPLNTPQSYKCPLSRDAKKVHFYTTIGATGYHNFANVYARAARYVELDDTKDKISEHMAFTADEVKPGKQVAKSFVVNYSNITDQLVVEHTATERFSITPSVLGNECGDKGRATVNVTFLSNDVDTYYDTITIHNANQSVTVYVAAEVDKHHQQITWNPATTNLKTTDNVTFNASTSGASAGLSVRYSVIEGSDVASVNATTGELTIIKGGSVTIQADADGDGSTYYDADPVNYTFTISKVTPSITAIPTAATMTMPNTNLGSCVLIGGTASVEGSFDWQNKAINATLNNAGYTVIFTPTNSNWYTTATCTVVVPVNKQVNTITWDFNVTEMYCNADYTFNASATSGLAIRYETTNSSVAYVDGNNHLSIITGGEVKITAYQDGDDDWAAAEPVSKTFTIHRFTPEIITLPTAEPMLIGRLLSDASLSGGYVSLDNVQVAGSFAWENGNTQVENVAGTFPRTVIFTPSNTNYYESVSATMNVEVKKYAPTITINNLTATSIEFPQELSYSTLSGSVTAMDYVKIPNEVVTGSVVWKDETTILRPGEQEGIALFVPDNGDWYKAVEIPVGVLVTGGYVFDGSTTAWTEQTNWEGNLIPGTNDPVVVKTDVEITSNVTVGSLTIYENTNVVIKDGGVLTVGNDDSETRTEYGNMHVENGGQLILGAGELKVKDFILDAKLGNVSDNTPAKSGQVTGEEALTITGAAYFDLALDPSGLCSAGWYDFTVPFPVDVMTGVSRFNRNTGEEYTIQNEVNYAIMDFSESRRVESGYGWKKFRGIMQPGQCYSITIDSYDNVYRFKKTATGLFNTQMSEVLAYTEGESLVRGWNGLGNGTMKHIDLSAENIEKVQIYNHSTNSYTPAEIGDFTYVVGSSYFVQAPTANSMIEYSAGTKESEYFRAPQRYVNRERSEFKLTLAQEGTSNAADLLYVGATEESVDEYMIGRDLTKFGTPTDSKVAQVWVNAYDMKLCDIDMQLVNNSAVCELGLFAPNNGSYTLNIESAPEDAMLYLTYNDRAIWNLTYAPYTLNLTKGTTEGYGLRIVTTQQTTTDLENGEVLNGENDAHKVMIDNILYIITQDGKMYDVVGNGIKF